MTTIYRGKYQNFIYRRPPSVVEFAVGLMYEAGGALGARRAGQNKHFKRSHPWELSRAVALLIQVPWAPQLFAS